MIDCSCDWCDRTQLLGGLTEEVVLAAKGGKGLKNRNFPARNLEQSLVVPTAIQDGASGMPTIRLTLGQLIGNSPGSSVFEQLVMASRAYGFTTGGANAAEFALTELGQQVTGGDEVARQAAMRQAVLKIPPFKAFFDVHGTKKVPAPAAFQDFLVRRAEVPEERAEECMNHILDDARFVGFVTAVKGSGEWFNVSSAGRSTPSSYVATNGTSPEADEDNDGALEVVDQHPTDSDPKLFQSEQSSRPRRLPAGAKTKVFVAHGKNRVPLEQLKKMLDHFKVPYAVAVDEPNRGRPVTLKVANLMRDECSSAIFIFTADQRFLTEDENGEMTREVWRPSENVVYELGAASILYDNRIVIFKEKRVVFPSDFSDLGYISFDEDQLSMQMLELMDELVSLDILEVRAKG